MMRLLRLLPILGLVGAGMIGAAPVRAGEAPAPRVQIPRDFKHAGQVHARGAYGVRIDSGAEGSWVVLLGKDGGEVARELAIVQAEKTLVRGVRTAVQVLTRDEHMVRVIVRQGDRRFLAYFETTS